MRHYFGAIAKVAICTVLPFKAALRRIAKKKKCVFFIVSCDFEFAHLDA
jgi:hypothetical protein